MHFSVPSIEYNHVFILLLIVNISAIFIMDYTYISLFIYFNSISINYIMYKDLYFEIKYKYSNINFVLMPNYYPSNRTFYKYIKYINISFIYTGLSFYCIDFWINHHFINDENFIKSFSITILSIINVLIVLFLTIYTLVLFLSLVVDSIKQIMSNYINNRSLLYFPDNEYVEYYCWVCDRSLNKFKTLKKLNCPCKEYFHPDCIDKYLGLYGNYCKNNHRIAKYEHAV